MKLDNPTFHHMNAHPLTCPVPSPYLVASLPVHAPYHSCHRFFKIPVSSSSRFHAIPVPFLPLFTPFPLPVSSPFLAPPYLLNNLFTWSLNVINGLTSSDLIDHHHNAIKRVKSSRHKPQTSKFIKLWSSVAHAIITFCTARKRTCLKSAHCNLSL